MRYGLDANLKHQARLKWHHWFAWRPVHLPDANESAWLEFVWRRGYESFQGLLWQYASCITTAEQERDE